MAFPCEESHLKEGFARPDEHRDAVLAQPSMVSKLN